MAGVSPEAEKAVAVFLSKGQEYPGQETLVSVGCLWHRGEPVAWWHGSQVVTSVYPTIEAAPLVEYIKQRLGAS